MRRSPFRAVVVALSAILCLGVLAVPAFAQTYPPPPAEVCVVSETPTPGQTITVSGSGFSANEGVTIILNPGGIVLGTATTDANGNFSVQVTIPSNLAPGTYSIGLEGNPIGDVSCASFTIVGGGGGVSFTGTSLNVPVWTALAAILLATGMILLVAARRRQGRHAETRA